MPNSAQDENVTFANAAFDKRIQLVEASFKTVLDSDLHEDDKAGRILSAMAFLTTAAAVIFNVVHSSNAPATTPGAGSSSIPIIALFLYIFFVLIGTVLYLGALGPSFNRPSWFQNRSQEVHSLLFFRNIGALDKKVWSDYWLEDGNTLAELQNKLVENYIEECRLIAQKEETKVTLMSLGSLSFRVAILFLVVLIATLFLPVSGAVGVYLLLGFLGIFSSFLFVNLMQPPPKLQLFLQKLHLQTAQPAQQANDQQIAQPAQQGGNQQGDNEKLPWQTYFLAALTGLSFIGFLVLLILRLIGLIA